MALPTDVTKLQQQMNGPQVGAQIMPGYGQPLPATMPTPAGQTAPTGLPTPPSPTSPIPNATAPAGGTMTSTGGAIAGTTTPAPAVSPWLLGPDGQPQKDATGQFVNNPAYVSNPAMQLTPEQRMQQHAQSLGQTGADAYPWQWNNQTNAYEAAPGYSQGPAGPGGSNTWIDNATGQPWQPPGFNVWSAPNEAGERELSPWDGRTDAGGNGANPANWLIPLLTGGGAGGAGGGLPVDGAAGGGGTSTGGAVVPVGATSNGQAVPASLTSGQPLPAFSPYGPGNDLRGTQINPTVDPRLGGTQGRVDQAAQAVSQGLGTPQSFDAGPESDRARLLTMQALEQMMSGPDRGQLAADALGIQDERLREEMALAERQFGSSAAKYGRLGSGNLSNSMGDYLTGRMRDRDQLQRLLSNDAANLTMSDRQAQLSGALGVGGQMFGQDLQAGQFGLDSSLADLQSRMGVLGALSGVEGQQYQQGLNSRNELRGERAFQNDMSQQSLQDFIQQQTLQEMLVNGQFGRDQSRINSLLAAGFSGDPTNALLNASSQQASQAQQGGFDIGNLLALWAQSRGGS